MSVHMQAPPRGRLRPSLLDMAAQVLVADPSASLAEVAEAAGIGRTTLHKHYATREALLCAVGHRAIDLWEAAIAAVAATEDSKAAAGGGGLLAAVTAMVPIGPQLAFLWRTPTFDHVPVLEERWQAVESSTLALLSQARDRGTVAADVPDWWLLQMFYSVVYVAAESVQGGWLAPRDAPGLALSTFLNGVGPSSGTRASTQNQPGKGEQDHE